MEEVGPLAGLEELDPDLEAAAAGARVAPLDVVQPRRLGRVVVAKAPGVEEVPTAALTEAPLQAVAALRLVLAWLRLATRREKRRRMSSRSAE